MILITGATGRTGSELVRVLQKRGVPQRAMIHVRETAHNGVDAVRADFSRPDSLPRVLEGVDRLYLVTPPVEQAVEWQTNMIDAARSAGVAHIVKMSMLGADPFSPSRFQRGHAEVEAYLENSGMAWTHLRASFFMQTVVQYLQGDTFYSLAADGLISTVDLLDVVEVAARALTEPGYENQTLELTGPEALTQGEMGNQLALALRRDIAVVQLSFEDARAVMQQAGFPAWNIDGILELTRWFRSGEAARLTGTIRDITGHRPCTFAQFAAVYALTEGHGAR